MNSYKDARRFRWGAALISAFAWGTGAEAQVLVQELPANPPPQVAPIPSFKPPVSANSTISADDLNRMENVIAVQAHRLDEQDRRLESQDRVIQTLLQQVQNLRTQDGMLANAVPVVSAATTAGTQPTEDRAQGETELATIRAAGLPDGSAPIAVGTAAVQSPAPVVTAPQPPQQRLAAAATPAQAPAAQTQAPAAQQQQQRPAAAAAPAAQQMPAAAPAPGGMLPTRPVGEAPPEMENRVPEVQALPEGARVLTPIGRLVVESSLEYGRTSSNRLVFRGVEIVPGIQLGLVDANEVARDTVVGTASARYGLMDRIELEGRIPFIYRHDRLTILSQQVATNTPGATSTRKLDGRAIGDVEFGARYQLNRGTANSAVYVGALSIKTPTGVGPYDVNFDADGIATELGTGSGFWAAGPSLSILFPSDPVVLFANFGYLHSLPKTFNKLVGTTLIGRVAPGDSFSFGMGFGFALNPQFSFSLGFGNSYILPTSTKLGSTKVRSEAVEVAILTMGWSYVFTPRFTLSSNFEFGMTSDAPDMRMSFRFPLSFF